MNLQELNILRNSIEKAELPFEKARGKSAYIGEIREYEGVKWIKTADGWVYFKKGEYKHYDSKTKERTAAKIHHVEHYKKHIDSEVKSETLKEITKEEIKKELKEESTSGDKMSDYKFISSLGGSSDVKLLSLGDKKYAIKPAREKFGAFINEQLHQEVAVDNIYRMLGFNAPESKIITESGKSYKISVFEENYKQLNAFSESEKKRFYSRLQSGFVLDCLLGNWDVIGAGEDNILIGPENQILRVDNGGSLEYRARGSKKPESDFEPEIKELKTFLDGTNLVTKKVFEGIADEEIKNQAKEILSNKADILYEVSKLNNVNLTKKVADRLQWLEKNIVNTESVKEKIEDYDKSKYSSKVTSDYFKDFDSLDIEGNKEIKEGIKAQILRIEKIKNTTYEKFAKENKISVEEYKVKLQQHIETLMSEAKYFRATDINILDKILNEHGRFKSQFETGGSHGSYSPSSRANTEDTYFKFGGEDKDKELRPIYGYCSENVNGVNNMALSIPPSNSAAMYGEVTIKVKQEVALKKATVTFEDSLGSDDSIAATPVSKPHFTSLKISEWGKDPLKKFTSVGKRSSYTEIQYHNQLKFDDIESVHISPHATGSENYELVNKVVELGRKTNIPIKIFGNS